MTDRLRNARYHVVIDVTPPAGRALRRPRAPAGPLLPDTRPALAWFVAFDGGIAALTVLALSPSAHAAAQARAPLPARSTLQGLLGVAVALHVGEAVVAHRTAARHGLPAAPWTRQTFVVGFPSLLALRRTVRSQGT
jgi:Domain of unknown function (DUF4499)